MTYKFDPSKPCVFAKDRPRFNGEAYNAGDTVPDGYSRTKLIAWAAVGIIKNAAVVTEPEVPGVPEVPEPAAPSIAATIEHISAGWYNVVVEGLGPVNPTKLKGKASAEAWAAENNYLTAPAAAD